MKDEQDLIMNLRGVKCPLNFVKIRLKLEELASGQTLKAIIDDGEPIDSVPRSLEIEGYEILEQEMIDDYTWQLTIKK